MSQKRASIPPSVQAQVLVECRRRCCVCSGLNQDLDAKKGQIAHLDGDRSNKAKDNLAFLCLPHHDEYDSTTSVSKNLTPAEVKAYRAQLRARFASWSFRPQSDSLLNFLSAFITIEDIGRTLLRKVREVTAFPGFEIEQALDVDEPEFELIDGDLVVPVLHVLDHLQAWGILTYEVEEPPDGDADTPYRFATVHSDPDGSRRLLETCHRLLAEEKTGEA